MAYQNNNNRITPEAKEDRTLKPAATPINKMINYNPAYGSEDALVWKNNAAALASIGKGMVDMDFLWKRQSEENAIRAAYMTEAQGGNKQDWKEVSKNIKGAARFNPYNDDAFRQIKATDIMRASYLELASTPDLEKMDAEKFYSLQQDKTKQMMTAFKEAGLSPKDYGDAVVSFNKSLGTIETNYINKNAEYRSKRTLDKITSEGAIQLETNLNELEEGAAVSVIGGTWSKVEEELDELGYADDTKAKVLIDMTKNYIARNPNQVDDTEIVAAVSGYTLSNGTQLRDIVPNPDIMIKDLCTQARQTQLQQMKLEVEMQDFQQEQNIRSAMTDFINSYSSGKLQTPEEIQTFAKSIMGKYNLDGVNSMKFLGQIASGEKLWTDLSSVPSDERVYADLAYNIITGEATFDNIAGKIGHGLNAKDALTLMQQLQTRENKQQTTTDKAVANHIKSANDDFIKGYHTGDSDIEAILVDPDAQGAFKKKLYELEAQYKQDLSNMTTSEAYKKFNDELSHWKNVYKKVAEEDEKGRVTGFVSGYGTLKATPKISSNQWEKVDINKSTQALRQMGIIKNQFGFKDTSVSIASAPQEHRKITVTENGQTYIKDARHTGYDLKGTNVYMGRSVYCPVNGTVVGVLHENQSGGMGNMVLVKCTNGKLIKYMHLQKAGLPALGTQIKSGQTIIGHIGNTGTVNNKKVGSLHVEFYDKNLQWITADEFLK